MSSGYIRHIIKDFVDEKSLLLIDEKTNFNSIILTKLPRPSRLPFELQRVTIEIADSKLMFRMTNAHLNPKFFLIPKHEKNSIMKKQILLHSLCVGTSPMIDSLRSYFISYLEQVKNEYESQSYTRTTTSYAEKTVEKKMLGLIPYTTTIQVPETSTITYNKTIKQTKLNIVCIIEHEKNDRGVYSVNISMDNHETLEDFIDSIKKNDLYDISIKIVGFLYTIRDSMLYGKLTLACIKIAKLPNTDSRNLSNSSINKEPSAPKLENIEPELSPPPYNSVANSYEEHELVKLHIS